VLAVVVAVIILSAGMAGGSTPATPGPGASAQPSASSSAPAGATAQPPVDPRVVQLLATVNDTLGVIGAQLKTEVARSNLKNATVQELVRDVSNNVAIALDHVTNLEEVMGDGEVGARLLALYTTIETEATETLANSVTFGNAYRTGGRNLVNAIALLPALQAELEALLVAPSPSPSASASASASVAPSASPSASPPPASASPSASAAASGDASASPSAFAPGGPEPPKAPGELVRNGGFEDPADRSWTLRVAQGATAALSHDTNDPATGNASGRVDITQGSIALGGITVRQEGIPVVAGRNYDLTMNVRAAGLREIRVRIVSRTGVTYATKGVVVPPTWAPIALRITSTNTDPDAILEFGVGRTDETTWIDTVSLRPAPAF
jgi:hypothetical protein